MLRINHVLPEDPAARGHIAKARRGLARHGIPLSRVDCSKVRIVKQGFNTHLSPTDEAGDLNVYTDGSGMGKLTGTGIVIYGPTLEETLGEFSEPTKILVQERISGKIIHYYCDNQAAIHSLGNVLVQSPLVQNTVYLLNNLGRQNQVHIFWVKAHVGTIGNERADCLAKTGAQTHHPSRFQTAPLLCIRKTLTKQAMRQDWQRQWTGLTTC
jgi:ribonuclease HI